MIGQWKKGGIKMIRESLTEIVRVANEIGSVEIEAKFGRFDGKTFSSQVPWSHYDRLRESLSKEAKVVTEHSTVYRMGDVRKMVITTRKGETVRWEEKKRIRNFEFPAYGIRVSINTEQEIEPPENFTPTNIRERNRSVFTIGDVRVDLTDVTTVDGSEAMNTYEVEVELIGPIESINQFDAMTQKVFRLLYGTKLIYTMQEKQSVLSDFNAIAGPRLVQARNLKLRDMVYGGLIGNRNVSYTVTHKSDGLRKVVILHQTGIWLALPPSEFNLVVRANLKSVSGTILEGEWIGSKNNVEYWVLIFDCLAIQGSATVQQKSHLERINLAASVVSKIKNQVITLDMKEFIPIRTVDEFYYVIPRMFAEGPSVKSDGLIFTPNESVYNPQSDRYPISQRTLTKYPDICKWKPPHELTIDFAIRWISSDAIQLYSYEGKSRRLVEFIGSDKNPFDLSMVDATHELTRNAPANIVVEYAWDGEKLIPKMIRRDKKWPNAIDVAIDVWDDVHHPITQEDMEGKTFTLLFRYHNRVKKSLFDSLGSGLTMLDIGSGRGGDHSKWHRFSRIFAVEPNEENREEFLRRVGNDPRITMIATGGEDTETITEAVGEKVDVVSLMLSLSFFWRSAEMLDALVSTIVANLKPTGTIVFLTQNGNAVKQLFEPAFNPDWRSEITLGPAVMKLGEDESGGRPMFIDIKDSIVREQHEFLVILTDLMSRLEQYKLVELYRPEEEKFLSPGERTFTSLYLAGKFVGTDDVPPRQPRTPPPRPAGRTLSVHKLLADDEIAPLSGDIVRIGSIANGDCILHAILKAGHPPYQENNDMKFRTRYVSRLRKNLAQILECENLDYPGYSYWETANHGSFVRMTLQQIIDPTLISDLDVDYSLPGLQTLLKSKRFLGDEVYGYISDALHLDVIVVNGEDGRFAPHLSSNHGWQTVVVIGADGHFETLGLRTPDGIQTVFDPDHPFIQSMRKAPNEPYSPKSSLRRDVQDAASAFNNDMTRLANAAAGNGHILRVLQNL